MCYVKNYLGQDFPYQPLTHGSEPFSVFLARHIYPRFLAVRIVRRR